MAKEEKLPPHNQDAEEAVLGSLLIGGDINTINLIPDDFYCEAEQIMYQACIKLRDRGVSINQVTLANEVDVMGKLEQCGGAAEFSHLIQVTPTHLDLAYYAEIVKNLAGCRKLMTIGKQIYQMGDESPQISEAIRRADDMLLELRKRVATSTIVTPEDRVKIMGDRYSKLFENEGGIATHTGLRDLDHWLGGGVYGGDLVIVGARPSLGKTTFLRFLANNIAKQKEVAFFSGEMLAESLIDRDVASILGVTTDTVRLGGYSSELYCAITGDTLDIIRSRKIYDFDDHPLTTDKVENACRTLQMRHGLSAVFVDYLGLMEDKAGENNNIRIGIITRRLKSLALELDVPVVLAVQLNRSVEYRSESDRRPRLSDLRDSGNIEQDADVVLFLYRDNYYDRELKDMTTEIIIAKQRQGQANKIVSTYYDLLHQQYRDLSKQDGKYAN